MNRARAVRKQRAELLLKAVFLVRLPDEIKYGQTFLSVEKTQSTAKLLQKYRQGFRRTQEHYRIYRRNIHTFVEQVNRENKPQFSVRKPLAYASTKFVIAVRSKALGSNSGFVELIGHITRMFLADAESQPLNAIHIGDVFPELFQYQEYPHIVAGVHL